MKHSLSLATVAVIACSPLIAAAADQNSTQLQVYPKNLARQHVGSNLFIFNESNQTYVPTEAAAAWLDDDATTGWPVMAGEQNYLLVMSEPELLTGFSVSARPANGTISVFAGDEPTAPGSASWKSVAKDVPFDSANNKRLGRSFSHFAKYLLIQTKIENPGPVYGLYVFGEKAAVNYSLRKRDQPIDARAIFGQYVNNQTDFNLGGLYSGARISYANSAGGYTAWQRAIDDNPETSVSLSGSGTASSAVISYGAPHSISRISLLVDSGAKGKVDFYAMKTGAAAGAAVALESTTPTVSIVLDGTNPRASIDFPREEAAQLAVRWEPANASDNLTIREIGTFNGATLDEYEVSLSPQAIAEYRPSSRGDTASSDDSRASDNNRGGDGKDYKDVQDPKKNPDPVAIGPRSPYLPGALGFPPSLTRRVLSPTPVSN